MRLSKMNKKGATSRQATNKQHADDADSKRFSQIRKKSAVICINLRHLRAYCINQHLEMSRRGLNMYNPLQAERSWGYRTTTTFSELRSSSIYYHKNHSNHSSDKRGRMDESTNGRKVQATSISSWLACLLLVTCCLPACCLIKQ
jgi:hypothetical protein